MLENLEEILIRNKRPVIAISYDYKGWILEKFAKHIKELNKDKYDFLLFSVHHLRKYPYYYKELFQHVDLILNMLPSILLDIKALTDKPIINAVHHWVDDQMMLPYIKNSQYIVTVSNEWRDKIINNFAFPKTKVMTIYCGIEDRFLHKHSSLYPKNNNLISLGFFAKNTSNENDRKGTRHLKKLIYYLRDNNKLQNFRIIISGVGWQSFIDEIRSFGANVIYAEYVPDDKMPSLYTSLDFYLMLSDIEGGPATVLESMASKTAVISNNIGIVKDLGINGKNIILIDPTNPKQIYEAIQLYTNNSKQKNDIIQNAYNLVLNMTYSNVFKDYSKIFSTFLKNYKSGIVTALNLKKIQNFLYKQAPNVRRK